MNKEKNDTIYPMGNSISVLYRLFQIYLNQALEEINVNSSEYMYIVTLSKQSDGMSQNELSQKVILDKSAVTKSVNSLIKKGYVIRKTDKNDKRVKRIYLTEKARAVVDQIIQALDNWNSIITNEIDFNVVGITRSTLHVMASKALVNRNISRS